MSTTAIVIALLIIIALATYATYLLITLKRRTQANQLAQSERKAKAEERRQQILTDIRYIAAAMLEDRCELSEGVMRIGKLFDALSMSEQVVADFPKLFSHYELIRNHPIMEARTALPKQQRMKLDLERMKSEAELEQAILDEAKRIAEFSKPSTH
ncbi:MULTISPECIES: DUF2489 domain-containing protein [Shewanella]|uniref:DUF2489 domain-containing protein n=1 Tax=Shewanella vesiculosa TaxID=518738 RepID=A0ABV0FSB1_9GAMM|nr:MULTISPECIES: DUF2489 domain-containing protein [Shewanella]NCQ45762.1 DUF2489 domain-containing protein [Shewanella frigidimarina]MBB1322497.1 DUF2489 domain-containing protein [Shewanella sp. SR43-8]MBB1390705.1 DUF2489 domain-containing protein [Shewanella sp. SG44-6]MBB1476944.1 DUF2489 domain-containing protein [Shewanella sp. SG41-3]NCO72433.1 DUF2489 domain-containing protein [Shewanella vesiculosa]